MSPRNQSGSGQLSLLPNAPQPLDPGLLANLALANARIWSTFEPPPDLLVSEWAEQNRVLPPGTTAKPGKYVAEKFQRGIMDAVCDPLVRDVTFKKSTQIGGSELMRNIIGFYVDAHPSPVMLVLPRQTDAENISKKYIAPMFNESPALAARLPPARAKGANNTLTMKEGAGWMVYMCGAESATNLRAYNVLIVVADEVDGMTRDADGEGDPLIIARRRTDSYPDDYKFLALSTPSKPTGQSRISDRYEESDQRMFHVPCPFCNELQPLLWRNAVKVEEDGKTKWEYNLIWDLGPDGLPAPGTVRYRCRACRELIPERYKLQMLNHDHSDWVAKYPERVTHAGFYINALYSPWGHSVWDALAKEWGQAKGIPERLRAFINLRLGETWDEGAQAVETGALSARRERYDGSVGEKNALGEDETKEDPRWKVPHRACVIVCSVDVQANRLEAQVKAFGPGEEEWLIDHEVFYGSPLESPNSRGNEDVVNVWSQLDEYLLRTWKHEDGADMRLDITLIDTGYAADACYNFILPRQTPSRRVFASKGQDKLSKMGLALETKVRNNTIRLFNIDTPTCKDRIMDRLRVGKPGPGYSHLPWWVTDNYLDQLTAESKVPVRNKRSHRVTYQWVMNQQRNEALDLTVYNHAGLWILQKTLAPAVYSDLTARAALIQSGGLNQATNQQPRRRIISSGIS